MCVFPNNQTRFLTSHSSWDFLSLFFSCLAALSCDSSGPCSPPCMSVIFQKHPQITTFHLFGKCLWSHVIWFSLHCPSVDGSWWGLREPSLLFSWDHVPKQHLAMPHSQTHTHTHTHSLSHKLPHARRIYHI